MSSTSIQFSILAPTDLKVYIEYGTKQGVYSSKSSLITVKKLLASNITVSGLKSDLPYYFRLRYSTNGKNFLFTTAITSKTSSLNNKSIIAIQADPHMDENSSAEIYEKTLDLIEASGAAFLFDLGDIFMVDKLAEKSEANIRARYELMRGYYQRLKTVPLKIVLGNHDGELGYSQFNTKKYRAEYFPEQTSELAYYSISHNGVLHIALDPFTFTTTNPKADGWQWTLGRAQYDWLLKTLKESQDSLKFVYIHHLLVGDAQSRGGAKIASLNEWGGMNLDGSYGFDTYRPGWGKPIHQILKESGVSIIFKGHDHLYVKEIYDGLIYQTLPQPSHPGNATNSATQYGYGAGKVVGGSGFIKVSTEGSQALIEFIKYDGSIADSYTL